jgi:hypothetical protein
MVDRDKILLGWTAPINRVVVSLLRSLKKTPLGHIASVEYYTTMRSRDSLKAYYVFYTDDRDDKLFAGELGFRNNFLSLKEAQDVCIKNLESVGYVYRPGLGLMR